MVICRKAAVLLTWAGLVLSGVLSGAAAEPFSVAAWGGIFDFEQSELTEYGVELRGPDNLPMRLSWIGGVAANDESGWWGHLGLRRPIPLGRSWLATPSFALTYYDQGDGIDLGQELQFRSGIELAYRWNNGATLGALFYHLSNAGLSEINPGENSLLLVLGIPLGS